MLKKSTIILCYILIYFDCLDAIYDGEFVVKSEVRHPFPYHATVEVYNRTLDWDCSGVIIRDDVVVTTAHCLKCQKREDIKVRAGHFEFRQDVTANSTVQESGAKRILTREDFTFTGRGENDVGLVWTEKKFILNNFVNVIEMAGLADTLNSFGKTAEFCAIGYLENRTRSNYMMKTQLLVEEHDKCGLFEEVRPYAKRKSICVLSPNNQTGPCRGDSGGPLVVHKNGKPILLGIASWGAVDFEVGNCTITPGFSYIGICYFSTWINWWMAKLT